MKDFKLSPNFYFSEAYRTSHKDLLLENARYAEARLDRLALMAFVLERIRWHFAVPITPTSWVRCPELNGRVSKSAGSYHKLCLGVDFKVQGFESYEGRLEVIRSIVHALELPFGKLILEPSWIHMSLGLPFRKEANCGKIFSMRDGKYTVLEI